MPYTDNVPQSGQTLGTTQPLIQSNFSVITTAQSVNHVTFDDANQGKHKFLQMPEQVSAPTTAVNEGGFYTKDSGGTNLFYRSESAGSEYQLTKVIDASIGNFGTFLAYGAPPATFTQTGGWTFLPGGLIMQYGFYGKVGALGQTGTVQFPVTFTNVFSVTNSLNRPNTGNQSIQIGTPTTTDFGFFSSSAGSDGIFWQAIGN